MLERLLLALKKQSDQCEWPVERTRGSPSPRPKKMSSANNWRERGGRSDETAALVIKVTSGEGPPREAAWKTIVGESPSGGHSSSRGPHPLGGGRSILRGEDLGENLWVGDDNLQGGILPEAVSLREIPRPASPRGLLPGERVIWGGGQPECGHPPAERCQQLRDAPQARSLSARPRGRPAPPHRPPDPPPGPPRPAPGSAPQTARPAPQARPPRPRTRPTDPPAPPPGPPHRPVPQTRPTGPPHGPAPALPASFTFASARARGPRRRPRMDDLDCDSTWEEDEEEDGEDLSAGDDEDGANRAPGDAEEAEAPPPGALQSRMTEPRNWRAMQDTRRYRHHYPDLVERDSNGDMPNLSFYRNEMRFLPNGCFIEDILQNWREDYDLLEDNHSYIQWLFPLREPGVNWHAKPLTKREIEAFKSSTEVGERLLQAYELMLGFYGAQLEDRDSGRVCRARNYQKRFQNLNCHSHNNLRITRILKSLGELGLQRFQAPLVRFFLEETLVRGELPSVRQSALDYFVFTVRCRRQRRALLRFAWEHFQPRRQFVWGPHDRLRKLRLHSPLRAPLPAGPRQAEGEASPEEPPEAGAQGRPCGLGREADGDGVPDAEPREVGALGRAQGEEAAGSRGEEGPEPSSPKESKKRKLEANRRERGPGEPGAQGASEVEKIALNLEGCALSQGSLGAETQETGGREQGDPAQPCAPPPAAKVADDVRKRRKVEERMLARAAVAAGDGDEAPAPSGPPGPSACTETGVGEDGVEDEDEAPRSPGSPGSPGSPERAAPPAQPQTP